MKQTPEQIIKSSMALPVGQRAIVITALQETMLGEDVDHGPSDPVEEVESAWAAEIKKRVDDVREGRVNTIPSADAWKLIDGKNPKV